LPRLGRRLLWRATLSAGFVFRRFHKPGITFSLNAQLSIPDIRLFIGNGRLWCFLWRRVLSLVLSLDTLVMLGLLLLAPQILLALSVVHETRVMLGMLEEVFGGNPVTGQLCLTRQHLVFFDNLLRGAANSSFRAGAVKYAIKHVCR